jgi:hypothetical protein
MRKDNIEMASLRAINRKAKQVSEIANAERGDLWAMQNGPSSNAPGKVYHPMGCTLNFTPGWEVDISGGTAGLCQPVERDLFDCYLGCGWPGHVPDHLTNAPNWTDKCASAVNDWRNVDIVFP